MVLGTRGFRIILPGYNIKSVISALDELHYLKFQFLLQKFRMHIVMRLMPDREKNGIEAIFGVLANPGRDILR